MSSTRNPIVDSIRVIPRESGFLNRKLGSRGEIFFDQETNTLRLFDGVVEGGISLLKADLSNAEAVIGATLGDTPPTGSTVQAGTLWFNTANGRLYILYNDGTSSQWVQPTTPSYGSGGGGGMVSVINDLSDVVISSASVGQVLKYNGSAWVNDTDNTGGGGGGGGGSGDVAGPASATDNAVARFDLATGKLIQNSLVTISDLGAIVAPQASSIIPFHYDNQAGFPSAGTYHGALAHSHADGKMFYAHAGAWVRLADYSEISSQSINYLSDVDTASSPPTAGQVLKWNGTNWAPAADSTSGAGGSNADTLDGFDSSYFLDFTNLSNKPNIFSTIAVSGQTSILADTGTDTLTFAAGTGIQLTTNSATDTITVTSTVSDTNTTYGISSETVAGGANLRLTGSDASTDNVTFAQGTNVTITRTDANTITIAAAAVSGNLDSLTDVTITSATAGQVLKYNGSAWINDTDATSGGGGGSGTVTTVSVVSANGFTGTVATATSTPAITLTTSITGVLKGNGTAISAATAGTDYQSPVTLTTTGSSGAATFVAGTLNIPQYTAGVSQFSALTEANVAGLTLDKIYLPAITALAVTNNGSSSYSFDQYAGTNPTIYAISGTTISFRLSVSGHPFLVRTSGGTNFNTGLYHVDTIGTVNTGASAQGRVDGTLYWKIPAGTFGNYQYICSIHSGMVGVITIKDISTI